MGAIYTESDPLSAAQVVQVHGVHSKEELMSMKLKHEGLQFKAEGKLVAGPLFL